MNELLDIRLFQSVSWAHCMVFPCLWTGLSLTMFINQLQYVAVLSPQAGLRMMLHRQGEVPLVAEDGFNVSPGTKSGIAVKYVRYSGHSNQTT